MDRSTLPDAIVAPLDTLVHDLAAWAAEHRDADLGALETVVRDGLRALAPRLVGGLITGTQRTLDPGMRRDRPPRAAVVDWAGRWGAEVARRGGLEEVAYAGSGVEPGMATLRRVLVLGDGARWIWTAAAEQFGERIEIVDWYHAAEHVWTVARAVYGDGTAAATTWAEASLTGRYEAGAAALLERLRDVDPDTDAARATLATERAYFQTNRARMRYPEFRAAGYPIGSGAVESSAKHVLQQRLKRSGCRWSERGGQALIVLCAHHATQRAKAA